MKKSLKRSGKSKIDIAVDCERRRCLEIILRNVESGPTLFDALIKSIDEMAEGSKNGS